LKPLTYTRNFFSRGHERTLMAKRNIAGAFLIKGGSILISLISVPLIIHYIDPSQYGIWLTISSFLSWFAFFDIGFGNGLKNKLAEAIAKGNLELGRIYVSTTYFMLLIISTCLFGLFLVLNAFVDWTKVLNAPASIGKEISTLLPIVFFFFSFQFVLQLVNIVTSARQNTVISSLIGFLVNLLSLVVIFVLSKTTGGSLLYLGLAASISPVVMLFLFSVFLYKGSYQQFAPAFHLVKIPVIKDLMSIGIKFFIIQIGLIFLYNTDNLIISNVISPSAVTTFNIAFKYFSIITMVCAIVMTPFWPAFTDANAKGDNLWIRQTVQKLLKFCVLMFVAGLVMLLCADFVYKLWVGNKIFVPFSLSFVLFVLTILNTYRSIFSFYFNGTGKIMLQLYLVVISGLLNIPLSIYLGKMMGTTGVVLATTFLCAICAIAETLQYHKLINKRATGIWNK
jgi:O-antigen/teichoic acid export membrane protein